MSISFRSHLLALATFVLGTLSLTKPAAAAVFNQQEINSDQVIAVAAPYNRGAAYQLLILEQLANTRRCWSESGTNPTIVDPLLVNFDFTGICNRSTDSNGYSVRVGGQDLGWRYSLRLVRQQNDLVLLAASSDDRTAPELEVGRTRGIPAGFGKIILNPGWRLTKRVYNGQPQGHFYLTNDQSLPTLIASAAISQPEPTIAPRRSPAPSSASPIAARPSNQTPGTSIVVPTAPLPDNSTLVPTVPLPDRSPASGNPGQYPVPATSGQAFPPVIVNPVPVGQPLFRYPPAQTTRFNYRVVVTARTFAEQERVKQLAPGAFRTQINGQAVMQAGLFEEQSKAYELQQILAGNNLQASVLPITGSDVVTPVSPRTPAPVYPGIPTQPIPNGQIRVVIDPGHGGGDPGAIGIGGLQEKNVVLSVARQVTSFLNQQGIQALLTRSDDTEIDLEPRVQFAGQANASVFVSIHANSINLSRTDISGLETYYYSDEGRRLAQVIHATLLQDVGMRDRGVRKANFYVIKRTSMPATLIEIGFVTGAEDAARLSDSASRTRIAQAIARGIAQYVRTYFRG